MAGGAFDGFPSEGRQAVFPAHSALASRSPLSSSETSRAASRRVSLYSTLPGAGWLSATPSSRIVGAGFMPSSR